MRDRLSVALGIVATLVLLAAPALDRSAPRVLACGPITTYPIFTPEDAPDDPRYLAGDLGIVQPTYRRRYLLAAWRTLVGHPLSLAEQRAYVPVPPRRYPPPISATPPVQPISVWLNARATVNYGGWSNDIRQEKRVLNTYTYIWNCGDAAFLMAAKTLEARRATLGASSPVFLDWVRAQDAVFSNCGRRPDDPPSIPVELGENNSAAARADRAYQIAAAEFYGGKFAEAEAAFSAIAHDAQSPWRQWAPYLAARAMIRQGTMGGNDAAGDPAALKRAQRALEGIVADTTLGEMHDPARKLLQFVHARTEPAVALTETAQALSHSDQDADAFGPHLDDFQNLINHYLERFPRTDQATIDFATARASSDLIDWIMTFQDRTDEGEHALERWNALHSDAWLVAAISGVPAGGPHEADLLAAAAAVPLDSPAYPTVTFHRVRLLLLAGERVQARDVLGQALLAPRLPVSSANLFKSMRMMTARTLDEFLSDAVRVPLGDTGGWVGYHGEAAGLRLAPGFDGDAVPVLNERMPLATLRRVSASVALPPATRRDVVIAIFTRALLLKDVGTARTVIPDVATAVPALRTALARVSAAADETIFIDEGMLLLLANPGLRPFVAWGAYRRPEKTSTIDDLRDNWWCAFKPARDGRDSYETEYWLGSGPSTVQQSFRAQPNDLGELAFLTDAERMHATAEWQALQAIDSGPNELGRRAIAWAEGHLRDPRAPQVLHLVVRATRYGCTDAATGAVSRRAFDLLHRRYPESTWAKQTPLWFK
jgi:hypothetical protein